VRRHVRHDGGVRHAESLDAHHTKPWVDDASNPAGRRDVIDGPGVVTREVFEKRIARDRALDVPMPFGQERRDQQGTDRSMLRPTRNDAQASASDREHNFHIVRIAEVIHADDGVNRWVGACEYDFAFAPRLDRIGEHDNAFRIGGKSLGRIIEVLVCIDPQALQPDV
jgi:hypothetical protein